MENNECKGGIAKGSRVLVKGQSFKSIEDIKCGDLVLTDHGWNPVKSVFKHGIKKITRIKHQDGYLDCNNSQEIAVLKDHLGSVQLKKITDLKEGDIFIFIRSDNGEGINKLPDFRYDKPICSQEKDIKIPELDEWMAWLLGEIHGDGWVGLRNRRVSIACESTNPEKVIKLKEQMLRFNVNVTIENASKGRKCLYAACGSKQLAFYFDSWLKKPKKTIHIPECVSRASHAIKLSYLQGLMDADGCCVDYNQCLVVTIYEDFAKEIQNMLYSMGIVSRLKKMFKQDVSRKQKYSISIVNNEDRKLFTECHLGYKKFKTSKVQRHANSYPINFFKNIENEKRPKYWHKIITSISSIKNIPYSTWNKVFGPSDIVPIAFSSIEETEKAILTYGIEIEGSHNFICEGILVKGC